MAQTSDTCFFKNGEKVCFIGNSITHEGSYHMIIDLFYATRFPGKTIDFYNCGISGDMADGMIRRFEGDILSKSPTSAFLMTGMNDVLREHYVDKSPDENTLKQREKAIANYIKNTDSLSKILNKHAVQTIFMTPTIYDQTSTISATNSLGVNDALGICAKQIMKLGKKANRPVVDLYGLMNSIQNEKIKTNPNYTIIGPDRIHPGSIGHFVMAYEILRSIQPSKYVSQIEIDVEKKVIDSDNKTLIFDKKIKSNKVSINYKEGALPFPIRGDFDEALALVPFIENFNQQTLKVSGLREGTYSLCIDHEEVGTYNNTTLENGINLAVNKMTPQYKQSQEVMKLTEVYRQQQVTLRVIPFVEYKELKDYKGKMEISQIKPYLDKVLDAIKEKSYHGYFVKNFNLYYQSKPEEKALMKKLAQTRQLIRMKSQTKEHTLLLKKIK